MSKRTYFGIAASLIIAGIVSLFASGSPDGLEYTAEHLGFMDRSREALLSIIPDYVWPGLADQTLASSVAGIVGTLMAFVLVFLLGSLLLCPRLEDQID